MMKMIVSIVIFTTLTQLALANNMNAAFRLRGRVPASIEVMPLDTLELNGSVSLNVASEKYSIKTTRNHKYQVLEISFH